MHHGPAERQRFLDKFAGHQFCSLRPVKVYTGLFLIDKSTPISCRETISWSQTSPSTSLIGAYMRICTFPTSSSCASSTICIVVNAFLICSVCSSSLSRNHKRYSSWRGHLLAPEELPKLESVCMLSVCDMADEDLEVGASRCKLDHRVTIHLAARCSNFEYLGCKFGADEWLRSRYPYQEHFMHGSPGCKCDTRKSFANLLRDVDLPAALKYVQLPRPFDPFSLSLRLLLSQLHRLDLHVMADDTLFWPQPTRKHHYGQTVRFFQYFSTFLLHRGNASSKVLQK